MHIQAAEGMEIIYSGDAEGVTVNHFCLPSPSMSIHVIPCGQAAEPSTENSSHKDIYVLCPKDLCIDMSITEKIKGGDE